MSLGMDGEFIIHWFIKSSRLNDKLTSVTIGMDDKTGVKRPQILIVRKYQLVLLFFGK